jgi:hypothetical protein
MIEGRWLQINADKSPCLSVVKKFLRRRMTMELEHTFQQSGFLAALQILITGSLLAPGVFGNSVLYQRFAKAVATYVVSFGPMALLAYVLYRVSRLC